MRFLARALTILGMAAWPGAALAAEAPMPEFPAYAALPFIGLLASIAILPLAAHHFWEHHQGKVAAGWALLAVLALLIYDGWPGMVEALVHALLLDYLPFVLLLLALFTVAGGIVLSGNLHGSPTVNATLLAIGAGLASLIGTTGASIVMIRPLLRANDDRKHNAHIVIFFIFLVSNIGGALTPLGDPPLFLGFLRGVSFFWTTQHLLLPMLVTAIIVLGLFWAIDLRVYQKEGRKRRDPTPDDPPLRLHGLPNVALIAVIIAAILFSAAADLGSVTIAGTEWRVADIIRDVLMVVVTLASLAITPKKDHEANGFEWAPIKEVAKLFAGIFTTLIPVLGMLHAGFDGPFAPVLHLLETPEGTPHNLAFFWLTGLLSSFLDNAPTYVVFFEMAGGNAQRLMTELATTLAAISAGAVFMGANSYIGNAPNFMVYSIARRRGVKMPSFFGYMLWSGVVLLPTFVIVSLIFFR
jgi:Na+/H+ antiporter NhaD/arsenite permease-like protein